LFRDDVDDDFGVRGLTWLQVILLHCVGKGGSPTLLVV